MILRLKAKNHTIKKTITNLKKKKELTNQSQKILKLKNILVNEEFLKMQLH